MAMGSKFTFFLRTVSRRRGCEFLRATEEAPNGASAEKDAFFAKSKLKTLIE
jgi:hypothetical protein